MYIAMWNLPGCLPEADPASFDSFEEARKFLADEVDGIIDACLMCGDRKQAVAWKVLRDGIKKASQAPLHETAPNNYVFSVVEE